MAKHGAREQRRLAKKKAKRAAEKKRLALRTSDNPVIRLRNADRWPIVEALVPENLWDEGLGQLIIARRTPEGMIAVGVFLVDVFCLGVKDCFWRILSAAEYRSMVKEIAEHGLLDEVSPEYLSKLVHCAADYAQSIGFPPHRDFRNVRLLLEGIDPSRSAEAFEFGKDGLPFYVRGPYESLEDARAIASRVAAVGGYFAVLSDLSGAEFLTEE